MAPVVKTKDKNCKFFINNAEILIYFVYVAVHVFKKIKFNIV